MHDNDRKLDCFVRVITPENIEFEYSLAGPFQRLPAFLFDIAVRAAIFIGLMFAAGMLLAWLPLGAAIVNVLMLLTFFALSWFYGIFFETRFNGRTPGKMVFKLRAISTDGRPVNASQAALRNLLRLADMNVMLSLQVFSPQSPPMYVIPTMLVGLVAMICTRRMQRIGDLAAGTMVVSEQRKRSPTNLQPEDVRAFGLVELIPANFLPSSSLSQTIGLYMENRRRLNPVRRTEVARHLADPLIKEFGLLPDTSPDLLLCAMYVLIFMSDEQRSQGRQRLRAGSTASQPAPGRHRTTHQPSPAFASDTTGISIGTGEMDAAAIDTEREASAASGVAQPPPNTSAVSTQERHEDQVKSGPQPARRTEKLD